MKRLEMGKIMKMREEFYDDYDDYDDDYGFDDDEIGYLNRELWEYEAEFDRAAREIEKDHRSPAAKVLFGLLILAAALAIYLGVSGYMSGDTTEEAQARISFVKAEEADEDRVSPEDFAEAEEDKVLSEGFSGIFTRKESGWVC